MDHLADSRALQGRARNPGLVTQAGFTLGRFCPADAVIRQRQVGHRPGTLGRSDDYMPPAVSQDTLGFMSANMPDGFFFQAQTCSS